METGGYNRDAQLVHDAVSFLAMKDAPTIGIVSTNPAPAPRGFFYHHESEEFTLGLFCHVPQFFPKCTRPRTPLLWKRNMYVYDAPRRNLS
jgi:hypothetical protein